MVIEAIRKFFYRFTPSPPAVRVLLPSSSEADNQAAQQMATFARTQLRRTIEEAKDVVAKAEARVHGSH